MPKRRKGDVLMTFAIFRPTLNKLALLAALIILWATYPADAFDKRPAYQYLISGGETYVFEGLAKGQMPFDIVRIELFSGRVGRMSLIENDTQLCSGALKLLNFNPSRDGGPDRLTFQFFKEQGPDFDVCPSNRVAIRIHFLTRTNEFRLESVRDWVGNVEIDLERNEAAEEQIRDLSEGPCGTAQWHGILGNLVALIACDVKRAVSDLSEGRLMRIEEADQAATFMRRGVIGVELAMPEAFSSPSTRRVECLFSEHAATELGASPEGVYFVKLKEFDRDFVRLECRPATRPEKLCAEGIEMFCSKD